MSTPAALTELEHRLAAPDGAELSASLIQRLAALEHNARLRLDSGLAPSDFQDCLAVADAAQAAREVLAQRTAHISSDAGAATPASTFTPLPR